MHVYLKTWLEINAIILDSFELYERLVQMKHYTSLYSITSVRFDCIHFYNTGVMR